MALRNVLFALAVALAVLLGCAGKDGFDPLAIVVTTPPRPQWVVPLAHADPESRERSRRKHYFLVAGASDATSYAWEIVQQKRYLRALGVDRGDVACFFALPDTAALDAERARWSALAPELADCYPANAGVLYAVLADGEPAEAPLYFYVSSHGAPPASRDATLARERRNDARFAAALEAAPWLDQFRVELASTADGRTLGLRERFEAVLSGRLPPEAALLTPAYLRGALDRAARPGVRRHVVVQACYSGGFVDGTATADRGPAGLRGTDYTVLTAAADDRPSFGCGVGNDRTFFGGAFNDALFATKRLPKDVDFEALHRTVTGRVEILEARYARSLPIDAQRAFRPSLPRVSVAESMAKR